MEQLKSIREDRGLSRASLAAMAGINPATVNRIENGERSPTVDTLEKLAGALDVEVADFFPKAQAPLPLDFGVGAGLKQPPEGVPDLVEALRADPKLAREILRRSKVSLSELAALLEAAATASETTRNDDSSRPGEMRIWMSALSGWETGGVAEELAGVMEKCERVAEKHQKVVDLFGEPQSA